MIKLLANVSGFLHAKYLSFIALNNIDTMTFTCYMTFVFITNHILIINHNIHIIMLHSTAASLQNLAGLHDMLCVQRHFVHCVIGEQ